MQTAETVAKSPSTPPQQKLQIKALTPTIGAEITGADIAAGMDEATLDQVRDALNRYGVVVLRDQKISPQDQITFSNRVGDMRVSSYNKANKYAVPGFPDLVVVSNIVENGNPIGVMDAGMLWHTDASYLSAPDMYSLLYALQVPHRDGKALGDTMFADSTTAYEALPEAMKQRLAGMKATHSFAHHLDKKREAGNLKRPPLTAEQRAEVPDVAHPIVRTHPVTGRKSLFVTEGHTEKVVGLPKEESDALLRQLWDHIHAPQFLYRHSWKVGDLLIWDNCATQHLAIADYGDLPRRMHRSAIKGTAPV
jgi:taurine dioxygenase